jgi:hypothetical protein
MVTIPTIQLFDSSTLLGYYQAKLSIAAAATSTKGASKSNSLSKSSPSSATANDKAPWENTTAPSQQTRDAQVLATKNFMDLSNVPALHSSAADAKTEQDNQKLFALYSAVNNLSYLATMAKRDGMTAGQLAGFNTRFQAGLQQIKSYIATASFNNFTLQASAPSASVTSTAQVPSTTFGYVGGTIVADENIADALPGVSTGDSFTVAVTKGGTATNVAIDLSQVQGPLSIDNIVKYVNQQLMAGGFATRFKRVMTEGTINDPTKASYGIQINDAPSEKIKLSSAAAAPALYVAGTSGLTTATADTATDNQGRLVKLTNLSDPQAVFNETVAPSTGTTTAQATVVDADGNVYMVGNATGNFANQLNQGSQDVYLTKVDSAGNQQWSRLLGSAGSASAASLALNPGGGVVVVGSTDANLATTSIADGNTDSFVVKYDVNGNQVWTTQIQTLNKNQAASVSVDASGAIYVGGQVTGMIGAGQVKAGGSDAYVVKLDTKGKLAYEQQFGTTGNDTVGATAVTASGDLIVASVENGEAILSKFTGGDATAAPAWQIDLGALQNGGSIGGLVVSGNQIYISGSTQNAALNAGGQATIANASSGGSDAFVFSATDNGASATSNFVSYVGTGAIDKAGGLTVGADGTVYLAGTTAGTFAGQVRNAANTNNLFVTAMASDGAIAWTRQYGGADGQSTGQGIAIDAAGSSVLDALGLPRGTIAVNQSTDLTSLTTLRAGDSFKVEIQGAAARSFTITTDKGETLQTLMAKINAEFGANGKASISYGARGKGLKIEVKSGVTAKLIAGPADFDALARLGIAPGTLADPATSTSSSSSSASSSKQTFGLGLSTNMDTLTASAAGAARAQLLNVLSAIQKAYQTTNKPASTTKTASQSGGSAPAYLQSQLSGYSLALNLLSNGASSTSLSG